MWSEPGGYVNRGIPEVTTFPANLLYFQQQKLQCRAEGCLAADECDEEEGAGAALVAAEHEVGVQRHVAQWPTTRSPPR